MYAKVVGVTVPTIEIPRATTEGLVAFAARVSSNDQEKDDLGLLSYCIKHKHWSVFEMADIVVEIECPRDISRQLIRHRSFSFQEFSQRYSDNIGFVDREARMQDKKNRQNSLEDVPEWIIPMWMAATEQVKERAESFYRHLRENDIAKECARVMLPEGLVKSKLYMKGSVRSWLHYLDVRLDPSTQKEHRELAGMIKEAITPVIPTIMKTMEKDNE